jgi:hypothetical protein
LTQAVGGTWKIVVAPDTAPAAGATGRSGRAGPAFEPDPREENTPDGPTGPAVVDAEAEAMKLLHDELGARPVESG